MFSSAMTMRAVIVRKGKGNARTLFLGDTPHSAPGPGQVLVKMGPTPSIRIQPPRFARVAFLLRSSRLWEYATNSLACDPGPEVVGREA
jgi:hypothetical protein